LYITMVMRKAWLWVFAVREPRVTLFAIRTCRGVQVPRGILGPDFAGTLGIDGWAGYDRMHCQKGQCAGHLLRRAAKLLEVQVRGAARFPLAVKRILLEGIALKAMAPELTPDEYRACVDQVRGQMQALLEGRIAEEANLRFARHLRKHHDELFTFLEVPLLEATNNLAEREIRPAVILRKNSAGNRTRGGARVHEVLASLSRTAERNGIQLAHLLPELLPPEVNHDHDRPERLRPSALRAHGRDLRRARGRPGRQDGEASRAPPPR
jgi:hypothetical protein